MTFYEDNYTAEQKQLAEEIIQIEKDALDKFYRGDTSGYQNLWSHTNFTYFDANTFQRVDTYEDILDFLMNRVEGKIFCDHYDFVKPRVQFGGDMAILTYQLFATPNGKTTNYNVIEVYQKNEAGDWKVVHSTWAFIRPFSTDDQEVIV